MKKISLISAFFLLFTFAANAQFFSYGIKGGLNSSTIKVDDFKFVSLDGTQDYLLEQGDSKLGFHLGMFTRINIVGFYIQPEFLFTQTNGEVILSEGVGSSAKKAYQQGFNKFDVPVLVGWKFGPAHIGAGPVASFIFGEKDGLKDELASISNEAVTNRFKNATFGYQVGVGIDILKYLTFDVKYEGNLSKLGEGVKIGNTSYNFDQRNPQWIFSLGIFF